MTEREWDNHIRASYEKITNTNSNHTNSQSKYQLLPMWQKNWLHKRKTLGFLSLINLGG
jgi:hypothetical protein